MWLLDLNLGGSDTILVGLLLHQKHRSCGVDPGIYFYVLELSTKNGYACELMCVNIICNTKEIIYPFSF